MNKMDSILYSIAEASQRLGVSYRTLHYYEQKFNLPIGRDASGKRVYSERNIELIEKIIELKEKGMSLEGIKTFLKEKGFLEDDYNNVVVIDENSLALKEFFMNEIKNSMKDELDSFLDIFEDKLDSKFSNLIKENESLKEDLRKLQRQQEERFKYFDEVLITLRDKNISENKSWIKKLFKK